MSTSQLLHTPNCTKPMRSATAQWPETHERSPLVVVVAALAGRERAFRDAALHAVERDERDVRRAHEAGIAFGIDHTFAARRDGEDAGHVDGHAAHEIVGAHVVAHAAVRVAAVVADRAERRLGEQLRDRAATAGQSLSTSHSPQMPPSGPRTKQWPDSHSELSSHIDPFGRSPPPSVSESLLLTVTVAVASSVASVAVNVAVAVAVVAVASVALALSVALAVSVALADTLALPLAVDGVARARRRRRGRGGHRRGAALPPAVARVVAPTAPAGIVDHRAAAERRRQAHATEHLRKPAIPASVRPAPRTASDAVQKRAHLPDLRASASLAATSACAAATLVSSPRLGSTSSTRRRWAPASSSLSNATRRPPGRRTPAP